MFINIKKKAQSFFQRHDGAAICRVIQQIGEEYVTVPEIALYSDDEKSGRLDLQIVRKDCSKYHRPLNTAWVSKCFAGRMNFLLS